MRNAFDRTKEAFAFEKAIEAFDCPSCNAKGIRQIPLRNFGHIDAVCLACGAGISVKYHAIPQHSDTYRAPPASASAYDGVRKLWGDERLFVLTGNNREYAVYSYVGHETTDIKPRRGEAFGRKVLKFTHRVK